MSDAEVSLQATGEVGQSPQSHGHQHHTESKAQEILHGPQSLLPLPDQETGRDMGPAAPEEKAPSQGLSDCTAPSAEEEAERRAHDAMHEAIRQSDREEIIYLSEKDAVYKARIEDLVQTLRDPDFHMDCDLRIFFRQQLARLEHHIFQDALATKRHQFLPAVHICSDPLCQALHRAAENHRSEKLRPADTAAKRDAHRSNGAS